MTAYGISPASACGTIRREELGKFQIITDVYGGFSYTEDLSRVPGEGAELAGHRRRLLHDRAERAFRELARTIPTTWYQTELVDAGGRGVKVCSWLKKTTCVKVVCESKSDWDSPSELINIRKVCSDVSVPRMKLLKYEAGNPPGGDSNWSHRRWS